MIERTKSAEEVREGLHVKGMWIGFISPGWASGRGSPDCRVTCVHHDHDRQQPENMRDIRWTYGSRGSCHVADRQRQRSKGVEKRQGRDQRFHAGGIGWEKTNRMFKRKMRTAAAERSTWPLQKGVALEGRTTETWAWAVEFEGSGICDFMGTSGWDFEGSRLGASRLLHFQQA